MDVLAPACAESSGFSPYAANVDFERKWPRRSCNLPESWHGKERATLPMQNQPNNGDLARQDDHVERIVLSLLLESRTSGPWSTQEIARELGDEIQATDAIESLRGAGLVHRCQELVFATRPAVRFHELAEER
jgi:hypothetical protein